MARTRSKPAKAAPKESTPEPAASAVTPLAPSVQNPPKLFVLPKDASRESRIVTLDNPATANPSRYLFCPEKGFYEFTRIAAPKKAPRSWLLTPTRTERGDNDQKAEESDDEEKDGGKNEGDAQDELNMDNGYLTKAADLLVATPIDIMFLLLPALAPKSAKDTKQHFLCLDDHLDTLSSSSRHLKTLLQDARLRAMIETRMEAFCDTVDAGDEKMYRMSHQKLLAILAQKAQRMASNLPASLEEKFIKPALHVPVLNVKREESTISVATETTPSLPSEESTSQSTATADSQTTTESFSTTATSVEVEEESKPALETPEAVPQLLRLRTSFDYLFASYMPLTLITPLNALLKDPSTSPIDFSLLNAHLSALAELRAEVVALRSISDNISRKRVFEEDEEKAAEREEKKRKKEEEDKKKKSESRGIKQLKKADTSGMKKLSAFFTKAPGKKA